MPLTVMSPQGELPPASSRLAPPVDSLEGKIVGLDDSLLWLKFEPFLNKLGQVIQDRYHPKAIVMSERDRSDTVETRKAKLEEWAEQVDCAVLGLAA